MLQLRKLHLQLTFEAARTLRKDVEDEAGAIEHATLEQRLEIALLARRECVIEQHQVGAGRSNEPTDFLRLTATDVQPRIRRATRAGDHAQHFGAGRARQRIELAQLILTGRTSQSDAHEESTFAAAGTLKQREPFRS